MKKLTLTICLLVLSSCTQQNVKSKKTEFQVGSFFNSLQIIEIDNCEYFYGEWGNATVLTHKGNCKFCTERNANK